MTLHTFNPVLDADTGTAIDDFSFPGPPSQSIDTSILQCQDDQNGPATEKVKRSGWIKFTLSGIPQGTQIAAAQIKLTVLAAQNSNDADIRIRAVDADSPSVPASYGDYTGYTRTTAENIVNNLYDHPPSGAIGDDYFFDVTEILQEILDRPSWDGSTVIFLFEPNNTESRNQIDILQDFEETVGNADEPVLYVEDTVMTNLSGEIQRFEPQYDIKNDSYLLTDFSTNRNPSELFGPVFVADDGADSVDFDGSDDYGTITDVLTGLNQVSLAVWVKYDNNPGRGIYTKGGYTDPSGSYYFGSDTSSDQQGSVGSNQFIDVGWTHDSDWHHWVFLYDGNLSGHKIYLDGTELLAPLIFTTGSIPSSTVDAFLGRHGATYFGGHLDSLRVFNRLLTTTEIDALSGSRGYNGDPNSVVGTADIQIDIGLDSEGLEGSQGELDTTIQVGLSSTGYRDMEGELSTEIEIGLDAVAGGTGSGSAEITLEIGLLAEAETPRFASANIPIEIEFDSEGTTALEGEADLSIEIGLISNNSAGSLNTEIAIGLLAEGAEQRKGELTSEIVITLSAAAHPPIEGQGLTNVLDDVILLQTHNFLPIPDDNESSFLDALDTLFVGEPDGRKTFYRSP